MRSTRSTFGPFIASLLSAGALTAGVAVAGTAGDMDGHFGNNGRVVADFDGANANDVHVDSDGGVTLAGQYSDDEFESVPALVRYDRQGTLDSTFSDDGLAVVESERPTGVEAMSVDTSGRLLVAGTYARTPRDYDQFVARFLPDGSVDESFGTAGLRAVDLGQKDEVALDVGLDAHDRVLVAGRTDRDLGLARLLEDGTFDPAFSGDGRRVVTVGPQGVLDALVTTEGAARESGFAAVTRSKHDDCRQAFGVLRRNALGRAAKKFSGDGRATACAGSNVFPSGIDAADEGGLVVLGSTVVAGSEARSLAIARFLANGKPDTVFGGDGTVVTSVGSWHGTPTAAVQDGHTNGHKLLVTGHRADTNEGLSGDWLVARYRGNGALDRGFAGDGVRTIGFGGGPDGALAIALAPGPRVVVAGGDHRSGAAHMAAARLRTH